MPIDPVSILTDAAQLNEFVLASQTAARRGGDVLMKQFGKAKAWQKGPGDWVTQADLESQQVIRAYLLERFPEHQFYGEEASLDSNVDHDQSPNSNPASEPCCWIVDPLDGTTNFVHQIASFSVSVAVTYRNRQTGEEQILAGTVFDPTTNECFSAVFGGGATLNQQPIRVSDCDNLKDSLTVFSMGSQAAPDSPQIKRLVNMLATPSTVRRLGSAALNLCYVACGRLDAYWATGLSAWDVAAGWLIASEAGAVLKDFDNCPLNVRVPKFCCACTPQLFSLMQPRLHIPI